MNYNYFNLKKGRGGGKSKLAKTVSKKIHSTRIDKRCPTVSSSRFSLTPKVIMFYMYSHPTVYIVIVISLK